MSTTKHLSRMHVLNQGRGLPVPLLRPTAPKVQIECVMLENPDTSVIAEYRSAGWTVAYEVFTPLVTSNGMKGHHFMRLEKATPVASMGYQQ
jgi:hypothetical protein